MTTPQRPETGLDIPHQSEQHQYTHDDIVDFFFNNSHNNHRRHLYPNPPSNNKPLSEQGELEEEEEESHEEFSPQTHPFARTKTTRIHKTTMRMNNTDPTNEFMYQIPDPNPNPNPNPNWYDNADAGWNLTHMQMQMPLHGFGKSLSEGGLGLGLGLSTADERGSKPLDLKALNERLHILGLGGPSKSNEHIEATSSQHHRPLYNSQNPTALSPNNPSQLASGFRSQETLSPDSQHHRRSRGYPSITELAPGDSISMYRAVRAPSTTVKSHRRGGTNVDPGEAGDSPFTPEDEAAYDNAPGDGASYWSQEDVTHRTLNTGAGELEDEMTAGPTSVWTRGDMGRDMYGHRDRLLRQESTRNQEHMIELQRQIREAQSLATTATKLEVAEKQLRELQARLIAEQVARTQIEQEAGMKEEEMKNYQNEWASAVRALRRARDEGKKSDEEKRRIQRCFEEARDKLWKYHEALRVREARAQGKEEGRAEAWQEAERWMGSSPPIPGVEPVQAVPGAVLHQTPMMQTQTPQFLQSPTDQYFQQQAQPPLQQNQSSPPVPQQQQQSPQQQAQHQYQQQQPQQSQQPQHYHPQQGQQPQTNASDPNVPMQSIAQLMEYFAQNPGAFPQFQHGRPQISPPQHAPFSQGQQSNTQPPVMPGQHNSLRAQQMPGSQTPGQYMAQMSQQTPGHPPHLPMLPQSAALSHHDGEADQHMQPQPTGGRSTAGIMPQHTGQPMTVPVIVPVAQPAPVAVPLTDPVSMGQLPPNPPPQSQPTMQIFTQPTIPQRTPRAPNAAMHTTPGKNQARTPTRTQAAGIPSTGRTGISTVPNVLQPKPVIHPQAAESYLEKVDHDPSLKRMMGGARSKTIHSSAVPPSATEHSRAPTKPHTAAKSTFDDGASNIDKPLPEPFPPSRVLGRSQTHRTPSTERHNLPNSHKASGGLSLSEGLHNSHAHRQSQIPDGDRYPAFPLVGNHEVRTHSRNTSFNSVDPAGIGLPLDVSNVQSPNSDYRATRPSTRQTPIRSGRTSARSRVAGALRNDMELEGELPGIEEADEEDMQRHPQGQAPQPMSHGPPPPHMMRQMQSQNGRGPPRPPPSMPNMRYQIRPVMPQPLGGGPPEMMGGPNKTFSEPHVQGHKSRHSLSALFHHRDATGMRSEHLPEPDSAYHPPKTHDLYVPPGLAPRAVSGGIEDVQGPRTSALGLSGVGGSEEGKMRAPTSSRSRSNQPPSAYYPPSPKTPKIPPPPPSPPRTEITHRGGRQPINLDSPPAPGTTRQTVIITERTNPRSDFDVEPHEVPLPGTKSGARTVYSAMSPPDYAHQPDPRAVPLPPTKSRAPTMYTEHERQDEQPHQIPLPGSRSTAPTAYTYAPRHQHQQHHQPFQFPLPPSKTTAYTVNDNQPHQVPLPPPRSIAPTAYTASPPDDLKPQGRPEVVSIDFASVPLPRGGATVYDMRTQVTSEPDVDEPRGPSRSQTHRSPPNKLVSKKSHRKPVPSNGNGNGNEQGNATDPRMYPLPPSKAPTRGRASTYATSVAPIEEVTEPESGRENIRRQSRVY
ncbi:uncharacterized protein IL334_004087 [Kwoniella shivajii]|uniref:Uncharacterized protein n=1 Tax=Kwoniella shivajii TaxID=564305 RepID=A0ABZ1CZC8_9TREE|nr:hypothetical protein IL334_004087 [Kwoniella shivajii]